MDEAVHSVADDSDGNGVVRAPADELSKIGINCDRIEKRVDFAHRSLNKRNLGAHALARIDPSSFPSLLDFMPFWRGKSPKDGISHIDGSNRTVEIAVSMHQRTAFRQKRSSVCSSVEFLICECSP